MTLLAFATERRAAAPLLLGAGAVDRRVLPAGRSAADSLPSAAAVDQWNIQTNGRTDGSQKPVARSFHIPCTARVNARRARLQLGWVTVFGRVYHIRL